MGFKDLFKAKDKGRTGDAAPDFSQVDREAARALASQGVLAPLYMMPLRFGGEESERNRLYVPPAAVTLKDRCDDMVEELLRQGKVNGYTCTPEYKGASFVPSKITVAAKMDGQPVFTQSVTIW